MSFGPSGRKSGPRIIVPASKPKKPRTKVSIGVETCMECGERVESLYTETWDSSAATRCARCLTTRPLEFVRSVKITLPPDMIERDQKELDRLTKEHLRYLARVRKGQA